jgi:hypothetical protein
MPRESSVSGRESFVTSHQCFTAQSPVIASAAGGVPPLGRHGI